MKNLFSHFTLVAFALLCSVGVVQSMELENLSKKAVYGATSQSKPLQKMPFHPVGPGLDQTLNCLINIKPKCVEGFYINSFYMNEPLALPSEIWEKIWGYLNRRDKLRLGSLAHSFEYIRQHVQLDVCREELLRIDYNYSDYHSLSDFYRCAKKIGDMCEDTKIDTVKVYGKALLEDSKGEAQVVIAETESWIKDQRHYTKTESYRKLKYLKEVFGEPDACTIWCIECKDECCDTGKDCLYNRCSCCIKCKNEWDYMSRCDRCFYFGRPLAVMGTAVYAVFVVVCMVGLILRATGVIGDQKNNTVF